MGWVSATLRWAWLPGEESSAEGTVSVVLGGRQVQGLHFSTLEKQISLLGLFVETSCLDLSHSPAHRPQMQGEIHQMQRCALWSYPGYLVPRSSSDASPGRRARGHPVSVPIPCAGSALLTLSLMLWASLEYLSRPVTFPMTFTWGPCVT